MKNRLVLPLCLACLCTLFSASAYAEGGQATILSGKVLTTVTRAPLMPFNAVVDEVLVTPGQKVQQGDVLMRYHLQDEAEMALRKELTLGADTGSLHSQIAELESALATAEGERNRARHLAASGLGSGRAAHRLDVSVNSYRERIAFAHDSIKKAEQNFDLRLNELSRYFGQKITDAAHLPEQLILTAPIDGHVLTISNDATPGALIAERSTPISIGNLNPMLIQVQVYEAEISRIKEGDDAVVEIPSLQNKSFSAKVTRIAWASNDMNVANPSFYTVDLSVPNPNFELKPGFKAIIHFNAQ